jgi:hypothetical protein
VALVAVVVGEDTVVGSVVDEQPTTNTATHTARPAMRLERALQLRGPS